MGEAEIIEAEINLYTEYDSNNSGGSWWLKDEDWYNLAKAGWTVYWGGHSYNAQAEPGPRYMGALACGAKRYLPIEKAIKEWEQITGQDASNEGCNCCGPPHSFVEYENGKYKRSMEINISTTWSIE